MTAAEAVIELLGEDKVEFPGEEEPSYTKPVMISRTWVPGEGQCAMFVDKKTGERNVAIGLVDPDETTPEGVAAAVHEATHAYLFMDGVNEADQNEHEVNELVKEWLRAGFSGEFLDRALAKIDQAQSTYDRVYPRRSPLVPPKVRESYLSLRLKHKTTVKDVVFAILGPENVTTDEEKYTEGEIPYSLEQASQIPGAEGGLFIGSEEAEDRNGSIVVLDIDATDPESLAIAAHEASHAFLHMHGINEGDQREDEVSELAGKWLAGHLGGRDLARALNKLQEGLATYTRVGPLTGKPVPPKVQESYFAICPRDKLGHCKLLAMAHSPFLYRIKAFTGKKEDSVGRTQCYQEGEHVSCATGVETPKNPSMGSNAEELVTEEGLRNLDEQSKKRLKEEMRQASRAVVGGHGEGPCDAVTCVLWEQLGKPENIVPYKVEYEGEEHALLFSPNTGIVIDPTSSQYDMPKIGKLEDYPYTNWVPFSAEDIKASLVSAESHRSYL